MIYFIESSGFFDCLSIVTSVFRFTNSALSPFPICLRSDFISCGSFVVGVACNFLSGHVDYLIAIHFTFYVGYLSLFPSVLYMCQLKKKYFNIILDLSHELCHPRRVSSFSERQFGLCCWSFFHFLCSWQSQGDV